MNRKEDFRQSRNLLGMFDELVAHAAAPKPEKHLTEDEEKMNAAVRAFLVAEQHFQRMDAHPLKVSKKEVNFRWWTALEDMSAADKALWHLFCGPDKSPRSNAEYAKFRLRLVTGVPNRSDA
jgi:hypothetical protein